MIIPLRDAARAMDSGSEIEGFASGYSVDTRTLQPGDLFFALKGEQSDGHAFVADALAKGAVAAVVERGEGGAGNIRVPDSLRALQKLAAWARSRWNGKVVGVTGSAGKTTTKDVIAALLAVQFRTGCTVGNFNNHVGLPLSILRLPDEAEIAVLELGMNHAGEIRDLAAIAKPNVGVVTNAGYAHVENFDGPEGVALAKRELIEALPKDGTAILNGDDPRVRTFGTIHPGRTRTFGIGQGADVRAEALEQTGGGVRFRVDSVPFESSLTGAHGVRNILAGIAVAQVFGIPLPSLQDSVRQLAPGKMRGERFTTRDITIINDCYNSNPDAARGMLEVLAETPGSSRIAVLGEMLELGRWSEPLHRGIGIYAVECGISVLIGIRGAARFMVDAAMAAGLTENAAYFFEEPAEAGRRLRGLAKAGDAILFKGSRGTHVEKALEAFLN